MGGDRPPPEFKKESFEADLLLPQTISVSASLVVASVVVASLVVALLMLMVVVPHPLADLVVVVVVRRGKIAVARILDERT